MPDLTTLRPESREDKVRVIFEQETRDHRMRVIRDEGVYRHLRFRAPDSGFYWHDIVTWPGHLYVGGDTESYVFCRLRDMFEFFEQPSDYINPQYWAQKLVAPNSRNVRVFSEDVYRRRVLDWFETERDYLEEAEVEPLRAAVEDQLLIGDDWCPLDEAEAHRRLRDFEHAGRDIGDSWEWDLREYDHHFLWACWAVLNGVTRYRWMKGWR